MRPQRCTPEPGPPAGPAPPQQPATPSAGSGSAGPARRPSAPRPFPPHAPPARPRGPAPLPRPSPAGTRAPPQTRGTPRSERPGGTTAAPSAARPSAHQLGHSKSERPPPPAAFAFAAILHLPHSGGPRAGWEAGGPAQEAIPACPARRWRGGAPPPGAGHSGPAAARRPVPALGEPRRLPSLPLCARRPRPPTRLLRRSWRPPPSLRREEEGGDGGGGEVEHQGNSPDRALL